ncbi:hypothetical protein NMY22_g10339 [Coprinellus aureogranulatus]|nr:hypothetical protein NMY22_g10339 [Coprinellus aureogranulatus]
MILGSLPSNVTLFIAHPSTVIHSEHARVSTPPVLSVLSLSPIPVLVSTLWLKQGTSSACTSPTIMICCLHLGDASHVYPTYANVRSLRAKITRSSSPPAMPAVPLDGHDSGGTPPRRSPRFAATGKLPQLIIVLLRMLTFHSNDLRNPTPLNSPAQLAAD